MSNTKGGSGVGEGSGTRVVVARGDGVRSGVVTTFPHPLVRPMINRIMTMTRFAAIRYSGAVLLQGLQEGQLVVRQVSLLKKIGTALISATQRLSPAPKSNLTMVAREKHLGNSIAPVHRWSRVLGMF